MHASVHRSFGLYVVCIPSTNWADGQSDTGLHLVSSSFLSPGGGGVIEQESIVYSS